MHGKILRFKDALPCLESYSPATLSTLGEESKQIVVRAPCSGVLRKGLSAFMKPTAVRSGVARLTLPEAANAIIRNTLLY